jgi:hypothetical protein
VKAELVEMGLLDRKALQSGQVKHSIIYAPWANVIFDHPTQPALDCIWSGLEPYGLVREKDDLHPLTNWNERERVTFGPLSMAGRFGQWKYYWTDDCVLRGALFRKHNK